MGEFRIIPAGIDEREYFKQYASEDFYKKLRLVCAFGVVMYAVFCVLSFWLPMTSLERAILLVLSLGIHLRKSKTCAYILLGFGILQTLIPLILHINGYIIGIVDLVVAVGAIVLFRKEHKE